MNSEVVRRLEIAVCQLTSVDDTSKNLQQIHERLEGCRGAEIVFFPENAVYMRLNEGEDIPTVTIEDPIFDSIHEWGKEHDALVYLGSVPLQEGAQKFNASVLLWPGGKREAPYKKIHLFDVDIKTGESYRESDMYNHGEAPHIFEYKGWKIGMSICYDLRFSELYSYYHKHGVDIITVPSAFTVPTGKVHWEVLNRARAIEGQAFVVAPAQGGNHLDKRKTWGHSIVVDPWGEIIGEASDDSAVIRAILDSERLDDVRAKIPMQSHRRL